MIKWKDAFSCKNEEIDRQHMKLIDIIERISMVIAEKEYAFSDLLEIITELDNYVEEHFQYEESLMQRYNYPELQEHLKEHNGLRKKLKDLNIFNVDMNKQFFNDILVYLVNWLSIHIMKTDKKLGEFTNQIGSK